MLDRRLIALALALIVAGIFGLSLCGCASIPPGSEADRIRTEIVDLAATARAVAEAQLADDKPENDAKARDVLAVATAVEAVLTGDATDVAVLIATKVKDPYAAALATWAARKLTQMFEAEQAARALVSGDTK